MANLEYSIFALANSLTKKEAKRITLFLKEIGTQHALLQLELFEALRLSRSDETEKLIDRLRSPELITYLSYHKNKLREQITAVLSEQQTGEFANRRFILMELEKIKVLYERGFGELAITNAEKLLKHTNQDQYSQLRLLVLADLLRMHRNSTYRQNRQKVSDYYSEINRCSKGLATSFELDQKADELFGLYAKLRTTSNSKLLVEIEKIMTSELFQREPQNAGFDAVHRFHMAFVFVYQMKAEVKKLIGRLELLKTKWEEHPEMIAFRTNVYGGVVFNLLNVYIAEDMWSEFEELYQYATTMKSNNKIHQAEIDARLASLWALYVLNRKLPIDETKLTSHIEARIKLAYGKVAPGIMVNLMFNCAVVWYVSGNMAKAKNWFQQVNTTKLKARYDLQGVSLILLTFLSINTDSPEFTRSMRQRISSFSKKHPINDVLFKSVDAFLKEYGNLSSSADELEAIRRFDEALPASDTSITAVIGLSEVRFWIGSKLSKKSIKEAWLAS